ncbi:helix-turn-helix transcriptional regulator [Candidatus Pacearchaeota archaeon]|nr:helix-turn-helix transcriptional regulator [Candidatus Pacearchaeota archaeon]
MLNKSILHHVHKEGFHEGEIYGAYKIFFGTLVSEPRLKIINLLRNEKKNVSEIMKELNMDQTAVSHDLARLRQCGFVKTEREGKFVYYSLNEKTINRIMGLIDEHMSQYCMHILHNTYGSNE